MKKILLLILVSMMMLLMANTTLATMPTSGACGENIKWYYDSPTATLTISGTGDMPDYIMSTENEAPWHRFKKSICNIVIKGGVTSIGEYSFRFCNLLSNVSIASTVKEIGNNAFSNCQSLKTIDIPKGVETIDSEAFEYCKNLQEVYFPNTLKTIKNAAFCGCQSLKELNLPSGITKIEDLAFAHCASLKSVEIPDNIKRIEEYCFFNCINLETVIIPRSIIRIKDSAFKDCAKITKVIYKGNEKQWNEIKFKKHNESVQYVDIECKKADSEGFVIAFVILLVVALTIFICKKKKYMYLIPVFATSIIILLISVFSSPSLHNETLKHGEKPILFGMYYQELGKNSYDPDRGILFKDNNEIAFKNYDNVNYFENWSKENSDCKYKLTESDLDEYDYRLEFWSDDKKQVYYIKSENDNDILTLYEYTPELQFTMGFFGKYLSEEFCSKNGYTEYVWN